jgi:transposase
LSKSYSVDLRERVLASFDEDVKPDELVRRYRVSLSWVYKMIQQRRETGSIEPLSGKPGPKPVLGEHLPKLQELVKQQPDATLEELRQELGISVGISTLWRGLRDLGITLKKSHPRRRAATA